MEKANVRKLSRLHAIKCHKCGSKAPADSFEFRGFKVRGWTCGKCGEKILNPDDAQRIFAINKLYSQKQPLTAKIAKVGNSFVLRIPKALVDALGLEEKSVMSIKVVDSKNVSFHVA